MFLKTKPYIDGGAFAHAMIDSKIELPDLAKALGISLTTLYRRIADDKKGDFTLPEVLEIARILNLSQKDIISIFFNTVSKKEN